MPRSRKHQGRKPQIQRKNPVVGNMTTTDNGAITYASTGNARVDFFFQAARGLAENRANLRAMLDACWAEDHLDTLKLIFQTRDCRGGKGEKDIFRVALGWLAEKHLPTLRANAAHIPTFGSWKDVIALFNTPCQEEALDMFAQQLQKDLEAIAKESGEKEKHTTISLAVKWAPTEDHGEDKKMNAASKLAKHMFKNSKSAKADYRKKVLVPLRNHLRITETFMCENRWNEINYQAVASRCMNISKKAFTKHDNDRFQEYLADVASGKKTIKGKQLFPHELVKQYFGSGAYDEVVEQQWKTIIEEVKKGGSLSDSLVLSDVSGSMSGTPMEVSVALGLLISEVTAAPFTNAVITFETNPKFHMVKGKNLHERVKDIMAMSWGGSTDLSKAFNLILEKAERSKLPAKAMPKRLFIISDMQFNQADGRFDTNHQAIQKKYKAAGYPMPQIVYWNVNGKTKDVPVTVNTQGVALVAGFSPSILKTLVQEGDFDSPFKIMKSAIDGERYKVLTVPEKN